MANKIPLADQPGPLKRDEIKCPICWSILIEPVALPCRHRLCLECFKHHVEETSLQCPCCRMRLSVWSRKAFREKNLVDVKLWERIQKEFPMLVQTRQNGNDSQDLEPRDLKSVYDRENEPEPEIDSSSQPFNKREKPEVSLSISTKKVIKRRSCSKREDTKETKAKLTANINFEAGSGSHRNSAGDGSTTPRSSNVAPYECVNSISISDTNADRIIPDDVEEDAVKWMAEEAEKSQPSGSSQKSVKIDLVEVNLQPAELERIRKQILQDRKVAKKLHKDLNTEQPRADNPYSIRSWLKRDKRTTRSSRNTT